MTSSLPVVGIPCCTFIRNGIFPTHGAGSRYVHLVTHGVRGLPLLVPATGEDIPAREFLRYMDGLLVPGSPSNVEPARYLGGPSQPGTLHDPARDATTLPLLRAAVEAGIPVLAICRGMQELNVAMGGSLHQEVHHLPGFMDHRQDTEESPEEMYRLRHPVTLDEGGILARLTGKRQIDVNTVHGQGIRDLAPGMVVEATAPDGLIEAIRLDTARALTLGVQWHPEWRYWENPDYAAIVQGFSQAVHARAEKARKQT
ncbi:MAG: gamma-glutamyl-gamma-aminobutyrate hydrolase family protein [Pseudomonadota bacterium]|nr:gamma-glutamyl-gamma-aminobutyrate hydrolase family protein [Pseudomonadota bacterium]